MKLTVIGSSSKGNCYILETETGKLLLDAGLPFKDIQQGLSFDILSVRGCLVTHEHQDHSKAARDVLKAGIDTYMTKGTAEALGLKHHRLWTVQSGYPGYQFRLGDFIILPFQTQHDAADPVGYLIQYIPTGEKLLFATDTYYIRYRFKGLNYILVECNYCLDILKSNIEAGLIPEGLKSRLLESHFSLSNVKEFLRANDLSQVRKIVLIHLSDGNSDAARMRAEVQGVTFKDVEIAEPRKVIPLELYPF